MTTSTSPSNIPVEAVDSDQRGGQMNDMGILEMRRAECGCCGPWLVESGELLSEFTSEDEAKAFYRAERIRRLAAIGGITDQRRIEEGIRRINGGKP